MERRPQMDRNRSASLTPAALLASMLLLWSSVASAAGPTTRVVSISSDEIPGNGDSEIASVSATGRFVAFESDADNLSAADDDSVTNVFVHDRDTRTTVVVSVTSDGQPADDNSYNPSISADGRYIAFESHADNLSVADDDLWHDVFVHDRVTKKTTLISRTSGGAAADDDSQAPSISADGRYVAFESDADNLSGIDRGDVEDLFVHDRVTKKTTLISRTSGGAAADDDSSDASISADGRYVAFESKAYNLSAADQNGVRNVFVHDRETKKTVLVSRTSGGAAADSHSFTPSISATGRYIAFESQADNLSGADDDSVTDVFVHDRETKKTTLVSRTSAGAAADDHSYAASISGTGRFVAFISRANNLSGDDLDAFRNIFVVDRETRKVRVLSRSSRGVPGNDHSDYPAISANGRFVGFHSDADSLSGADDNAYTNVLLHGPLS
jgi:Tol biopolymer transport system component